MKIKHLFISSALGIALFTAGSALTANASAWHKGVPSVAKTASAQWLGHNKNKSNGDYYRYFVVIKNNQVGYAPALFTKGGKGIAAGGGAPWLSTPYYEKTGSNTYKLKATGFQQDGQHRQMILKKSGKNLKISLYENKKWKNLGTFTKKTAHNNMFKVDPFK